MDAVKMGIGFCLWQKGVPDAYTLFGYIEKAEAWGIDSVWVACHPSRLLHQLALYAEEIIPHFEEMETPAVSSASTT